MAPVSFFLLLLRYNTLPTTMEAVALKAAWAHLG
jgi:hypothetical protein